MSFGPSDRTKYSSLGLSSGAGGCGVHQAASITRQIERELAVRMDVSMEGRRQCPMIFDAEISSEHFLLRGRASPQQLSLQRQPKQM